MEEKVTICILNEGGKSPKSMCPEEQVAQGIVNSAKIVVSNEEIDESTSVETDIEFEISPAEVGFIIEPTYNV